MNGGTGYKYRGARLRLYLDVTSHRTLTTFPLVPTGNVLSAIQAQKCEPG
jgi:hypothetical protein